MRMRYKNREPVNARDAMRDQGREREMRGDVKP